MKLKHCGCTFGISGGITHNICKVLVIFVILILKLNYGYCDQALGDKIDAVSTADSDSFHDLRLNDETFKFYDTIDELQANLSNDTADYLNDDEGVDEEILQKLIDSYEKAYTNDTWIVVPKESDIIETVHDIVEDFENVASEEIVIVTKPDDNVESSQRQHDDLQFGLEVEVASTGVMIDTTESDILGRADGNDEINGTTEEEIDEGSVITTEIPDDAFRNGQTVDLADTVEDEDQQEDGTTEPIMETASEQIDAEITEIASPQTNDIQLVDQFKSDDTNIDLTEVPTTEEPIQDEMVDKVEEELVYRINNAEPETTEVNLEFIELTETPTEVPEIASVSNLNNTNTQDVPENDDMLIDELDPVIVEIPKPVAEPAYEDYTTEDETTTEKYFDDHDIDDIIGHKVYLHDLEVFEPPVSSPQPILIPKPPATVTEEIDIETTPKPSGILQKISSYMYGIFNYRYAKADGRNFDEIDPYDFTTEDPDDSDFITAGYDETDQRQRAEEQSLIEIEKILDPEIKNEFIKDIVVDKSPEVQSVFQKPDESNILNRAAITVVDNVGSDDGISVERFIVDKINRDASSSREYEEETIDNNLYSNPEQNSRVSYQVPSILESKSDEKTISEIEKIIDPEIQNEFIKEILSNANHERDDTVLSFIADHNNSDRSTMEMNQTVASPAVETVRVVDNVDGARETHVTERTIEEAGRHIHDQNKVESFQSADLHKVIHESVHVEQSNETRTEDDTKVEIETDEINRLEVQHVTHEEDEKNVHSEKQVEHVTIDRPGLHMENHETVQITKTKDGKVTDTEDIITKDLDGVHVVEKIKIHEDNKNVYEQLLKKEEEIKKNKNKIDELKREIDILKEDIKRPNELIAYEAEVLKTKGYLPDKLELIGDYLNYRGRQMLHGQDTDKIGLKRYIQRLTKERELKNLKLKKDKLKEQLVEDFKEFMSAEHKFGIRLDDEIERSVEKFDKNSKSSGSSSASKSKNSKSSDENDDDSNEESEERTWNNFMKQAREAAAERVQRREEEVKLLQHVLNDDSTSEALFEHITLPPFISSTPVPVLYPDMDKESQIILLETLVRLPTVEKVKDLRNLPFTTESPVTTGEPITEEISIEIDETEKMVDAQGNTVKTIEKRVPLHNGDDKVEIDETINTNDDDVQLEVHNKRIQRIDEKIKSRIIEVLMPKLREQSMRKQNLTSAAQGRSLDVAILPQPETKDDKSDTESTPAKEEEEEDSVVDNTVITNEALRTLVEGVELTSEITRSIDTFRSPIEKISEILVAADPTAEIKKSDDVADQIGRAEEILGAEEKQIVSEIAELEQAGLNLALLLFCILCTFLIVIIAVIFFVRKSKRFSGLDFIPV